ncbi:MAG TPA: redoxin domain-containing protein, partial [Pyrinomonadaceae bacterium]|nr:redoxin domain-containing protein [Pyrinomonadaceae bacterium]
MLKLKPQAAIAVALAFLFALSNVTQGFSASSRAALLDFRLKTTDGGEISSEMLRGDIVVLAFGASWLPLSKAQVQGVQELADEFGEREVRVY